MRPSCPNNIVERSITQKYSMYFWYYYYRFQKQIWCKDVSELETLTHNSEHPAKGFENLNFPATYEIKIPVFEYFLEIKSNFIDKNSINI